MVALSHRYAETLRGICSQLEAGAPPWWGDCARLGSPILSRGGGTLRGLPAVVAWDAGNRLARPALVWQLVPGEQALGSEEGVVIALPANGGEALYGAVPYRRVRRAEFSVPEPHRDQVTVAALGARLDGILAGLGRAAPEMGRDRGAVASLAQAMLRPVAESDWPLEEVELGGGWDGARLSRVAAWGRLLADDALLSGLPLWARRRQDDPAELAFRPLRWRLKPPGMWRDPRGAPRGGETRDFTPPEQAMRRSVV